MNIRIVITATVLSLTTSLALAQQQTQEEQHHPADESAQTTTPGEGTSLEPTIEQLEAAQMQWDKVMQTQDPEERRRLMMEYRQKMHATIPMMRAMRRVEQQLADLQPTPEEIEQAQAEWEKIMQTDDPEERHRLMMDYRDKMHSSIALMRAMHQVQRARAAAHAGPEAMRGMHARRGAAMAEQGMPMHEMMQQMRGGQGMMMGMAGMMEAYRQMDKRLDLMQNILERLMAEQQDRE